MLIYDQHLYLKPYNYVLGHRILLLPQLTILDNFNLQSEVEKLPPRAWIEPTTFDLSSGRQVPLNTHTLQPIIPRVFMVLWGQGSNVKTVNKKYTHHFVFESTHS